MARRVWVVPPTWNNGTPSSPSAGSDDKAPGKGRTALRRLASRRARAHEKPGDPGDATSGEAINTA